MAILSEPGPSQSWKDISKKEAKYARLLFGIVFQKVKLNKKIKDLLKKLGGRK